MAPTVRRIEIVVTFCRIPIGNIYYYLHLIRSTLLLTQIAKFTIAAIAEMCMIWWTYSFNNLVLHSYLMSFQGWNSTRNYRYVIPKRGSLLLKETWSTARRHCLSMKGDLVSIRNREEQEKVKKAVHNYRYNTFWIGANDIKKEGRFEWSDGNPLSFTFWWAGEPNNKGSRGQEDCVHLKLPRYRRTWNDLNCSLRNPYICKIPE